MEEKMLHYHPPTFFSGKMWDVETCQELLDFELNQLNQYINVNTKNASIQAEVLYGKHIRVS